MKKNIIIFYFFIMCHTLYPITYYLGATPQNPGFFSIFFSVVGALDFYEKGIDNCDGLIVDFGKQGLYYDVKYGPNWWEYYFEPINLGVDNPPREIFPKNKHSFFSVTAGYQMSRERGYELIQKYIKLKPHLQKKIDEFVKEHFEGHHVIGVHYRGTDKSTESPLVPYKVMIKLMKNECAQDPNLKIFVATDEEKFLKEMYKNFPGKIIAASVLRSQGGYPVHYTSHNGAYNYKKGEDAVMDCILLSKCSKLYKTSSNLSSASARFNPFMDVILLSRGIHEMDLEHCVFNKR